MAAREEIFVSSEIGRLRRLIIHSPDGGIGKIVPGKFKEWLYDDTVHLAQMRREYNTYVKILLWFLDPEKAKYVARYEAENPGSNNCFKPDNDHYFNSSKVLDSQYLLAGILEDEAVRKRVISAVCAWEGVSTLTEKKLENITDAHKLAKTLISGTIADKVQKNIDFIFPPLPNFIFTRDIAVTVNDHLLLSNAHTPARERESLLARFIAQYRLFKGNENKLIEISEPGDFFLLSEDLQQKKKTSIEGGDVMMVSPNHLLIGCSERTTASGINEVIHAIFENNKTGIEKISVIKIPKDRAIMHIDTIFTQVRKDVWVLFGRFSEKVGNRQKRFSYYEIVTHDDVLAKDSLVEIFRFEKKLSEEYLPEKNYQVNISDKITGLESLLRNISMEDFGVRPDDVKIIYSADNIYPFDEREQWTDSCNLLALKNGVVIGYERNEHTIQSFARHGFEVVNADDLVRDFEAGLRDPEAIENTLVLLASSELSRARGGSHCMSMPLLRDKI